MTKLDRTAADGETRDLEGWTLAFDLDGTLVDSAPDLLGTLNAILAEEGLPALDFTTGRSLIGQGARALLRRGLMAAGAQWDEAMGEALFQRFLAHYRTRIADESRPFEGVETTLERLATRGAILCVATNKRTELSVALLDALDLSSRFAAICGPDAVSRHKPSGAHVREAVQKAGGDPARAIMVGDAAPDVGAAKDAGVPVVVVTFGYTPVPAEDLGGDVLIDAFEDLEEAVDGLVAGFYVRRALAST